MRGGLIQVLLGGVLIGVGGAVSYYTYINAEPGESYFLWFGLPIVGLVVVLRGLYRITTKKDERPDT